VVQYLLQEQEASMTDSDDLGSTVWRMLLVQHGSFVELSSLFKVMVMLEVAPASFIASPWLSPQHKEICTRGRQLRAQLPSYLEQQRAVVVTHCPLPVVLQSIVVAYAATTPEDMWTDGLHVQAPRSREKGEAKGEAAPLPRRSLRLRRKRS
jgi:hypothetical protein